MHSTLGDDSFVHGPLVYALLGDGSLEHGSSIPRKTQ